MNVLLFSPGIDSCIAHWFLKTKIGIEEKNLILVYYVLNTRYSIHEYGVLRSWQHLKINFDYGLNLGPIEQPDAYVPCRNALMVLHSAGAYNADCIFLNGTLSDRVSDNTVEAYKKMESLATVCLNRNIKVTSPFPPTKYKEELVLDYIKENDPKTLLETFSCYDPVGDMNPAAKNKSEKPVLECLNCKACFRKNVVLNLSGIKRPFRNNLIIDSYKKEFKDQANPRKEATIKYLMDIGKLDARTESFPIHNTK
jgi:7-cyano-7-deazaguanine synthase in queuosine biosynthesis